MEQTSRHGLEQKQENEPLVSAGQHDYEHKASLWSKAQGRDYEEEGEEENDDQARLFQPHQLNQERLSGPAAPMHPPLASSPDSTDSNDFVKLEKPNELYSGAGHPAHVDVHLPGRTDEITPSDDVAPPVGDDLRDFAPSPQHAAHNLSGRAHQTLEQFLASASNFSPSVERDFSSLMHHRSEMSSSSGRRIMFDDEEEDTFRRHGPLTLGQPVSGIKPLQQEALADLLDSSPDPLSDRVGEFASKMVEDARAGAFTTREMFDRTGVGDKDTLDLDDTPVERESPAPFGESLERYSSTDVPDTPLFLPPARPPTPPKPRASDAPETPPILDLGGPGHPHHHAPPYRRKSSLKVPTSTLELARGTGVAVDSTTISTGPSWFHIRHWDHRVLDLIYWRDPRKSGVVFTILLALLLSLATFNIITVGSYVGLLALAAAVACRVYTTVTSFVNKTEQKDPFQRLLKRNLDLPQDCVHEQVDVVLKKTKDQLDKLRRLVLVDDLYETLKFAVLLWLLTYVGAYFNGTMLIIAAFIGLFTLPKAYELYQPQIDQYYTMAESKVKQASDVAKEHLDKVPIFKKKQQ